MVPLVDAVHEVEKKHNDDMSSLQRIQVQSCPGIDYNGTFWRCDCLCTRSAACRAECCDGSRGTLSFPCMQ